MKKDDKEFSEPLSLKDWAVIFGCSEQEALAKLERMESEGNAIRDEGNCQ